MLKKNSKYIVHISQSDEICNIPTAAKQLRTIQVSEVYSFLIIVYMGYEYEFNTE